jgi:hypothetical protein
MDQVERADDAAGVGGGSALARGDDGDLADAELIRAVDAALFGWPVADQMCRALEVNRRTVQRWLNGQNEVPPYRWEQLAEMLEERMEELRRLREALAARADDQR